MTTHAVDDVTAAFEASKTFLRGLTVSQWLRLAIIALLTGGASAPSTSFQFDGSSLPSQPTDTIPPMPDVFAGPGLSQFVIALVAALVLVGLALVVVGSILQFAFVDALRTGRVEIRRSLARFWGKGLRLFGFHLAVGLVVLAAFGFALLPSLGGGFLVTLLFLPVALVVALLAALVTGFTRAFVVPIMLHEDRGVLAAWRRLWGVVCANPKEYGAFVLVNLALTIAAGIVVGIASMLVAVVVAVPAGIVFGLPILFTGASGVLAWAWPAIGVLLGGLAFLLGIGLVNVPVQSYLRYYALFLLGDTDATLDLIPDRRSAARGSAPAEE